MPDRVPVQPSTEIDFVADFYSEAYVDKLQPGTESCYISTERYRSVKAAVRGHLHELDGDLPAAATAYVEAARRATNVAERDHLVRQAARARASELSS